jgi:hypothetical protein
MQIQDAIKAFDSLTTEYEKAQKALLGAVMDTDTRKRVDKVLSMANGAFADSDNIDPLELQRKMTEELAKKH